MPIMLTWIRHMDLIVGRKPCRYTKLATGKKKQTKKHKFRPCQGTSGHF